MGKERNEGDSSSATIWFDNAKSYLPGSIAGFPTPELYLPSLLTSCYKRCSFNIYRNVFALILEKFHFKISEDC